MKKTDYLSLIVLISIAGLLICFSPEARQGAADGLMLAQNTIIPSLLPLLIIFLLIMKSSLKDILSKLFGRVSFFLFGLPYITFPAILFGMIGGYPTGALLTKELYDNEEIDRRQAQRMVCFNFCGGCGFIITAVGVYLKCSRAGVILFLSNALSSLLIGILLSVREPRTNNCWFSYTKGTNVLDRLNDAVSSALSSVLNITAYIILFSAVNSCVNVPMELQPVLEITNGIFNSRSISLSLLSAYLSFGGLCIHFQLFGIIKEIGLSYFKFLFFRLIGAVLSFFIAKGLLLLCPIDINVFSAIATPVSFGSVNYGLSALLIIGCFVMILDINSRKKVI